MKCGPFVVLSGCRPMFQLPPCFGAPPPHRPGHPGLRPSGGLAAAQSGGGGGGRPAAGGGGTAAGSGVICSGRSAPRGGGGRGRRAGEVIKTASNVINTLMGEGSCFEWNGHFQRKGECARMCIICIFCILKIFIISISIFHIFCLFAFFCLSNFRGAIVQANCSASR